MVPKLGVELELQLPAYTTAIATPDPSCICDQCYSSQQHWILNPLSEAGIEPASLWLLVRSVSTEPRWELPRLILFIYLFIYLFILCRAASGAYGGSQAKGLIRAAAAGLHHSHSNLGSQPHLRPTPQLMAIPDP